MKIAKAPVAMIHWLTYMPCLAEGWFQGRMYRQFPNREQIQS